MIETDFYILTHDQYEQFNQYAAVEGVSLDYYLMEFCDVQGEDVFIN
jgi:hypothetical protein